MPLPIRATLEDIQILCGFFAKKPTGATIAEAKAVLNDKVLDTRKISALKTWGLLVEEENRLKATSECRLIAKDNGANREITLKNIVLKIPAYKAILERVFHRQEEELIGTDVGAHWHEHFRDEVSTNDEILLDQVICFFQIAQGAGFGEFIVGRKGSATRFKFNTNALSSIFDADADDIKGDFSSSAKLDESVEINNPPKSNVDSQMQKSGQGIFVAHGKNKKPLEQLKKILDQFKIPYKVAIDEPNLGRPIGTKVREVMHACNCAILIFTADEEFKDKDGKTIWRPSENVIYELGAVGYLYDSRIVIMKEEGVVFPSNFQDIGYISFEKDELEAKAMEILKELIGFGIVKVST